MLTALEVSNAKARIKPYKFADDKGLFLHVATSGRKTWRYRYELPPGTESIVVQGEYPVMTLESARIERASMRELIKAGINPAESKRQKKREAVAAKEEQRQAAENSFEAVMIDWHRHQKDRWTANHAEAVLKSLMRYAYEPLGKIPVDEITPPMVLQVVRSIEAKGSLEMASKTLQRIGAVFRFAIQTGRATYNPAADMHGALKAKKVQHHTMVPPEELPEFL